MVKITVNNVKHGFAPIVGHKETFLCVPHVVVRLGFRGCQQEPVLRTLTVVRASRLVSELSAIQKTTAECYWRFRRNETPTDEISCLANRPGFQKNPCDKTRQTLFLPLGASTQAWVSIQVQ